MAPIRTQRRRFSPVAFVTAYDEQIPDEFVLPEDITSLTDEELSALAEQANAAFDALYGDGTNVDPANLGALRELTEAIETIDAETATRTTAQAERDAEAAELAARVRGDEASDTDPAETDETDDEGDGDVEDEDTAPDGEGGESTEVVDGEPVIEAVAAAATARREVRVNLAGLARRTPTAPASPGRRPGDVTQMSDLVVAANDLPGFAGQPANWLDLARGIDRRLMSFQESEYARAAQQGRHIKQQFGVAVITKPFADDMVITSDDIEHQDAVLRHAMDEKRLPQGSLVASGGWCAPSETIYDLCELESRDGLYDLPEIGVRRGGIRRTLGPDFSSIYSDTGFTYTEADDIAGDYDGNGGGSKPCFKVDCPDFEDNRLDLAGVCITAGLLQSRGYPEMIARTTRGALVAHDHRMSANLVSAVITGSDAVTFDANQVGTTAPILTAIELQVEHMKDLHRMSRMASIEAVFPFWVRGAIRADLARRTGVDLISVPDARIEAWFRERGVAPQFIYNWQGLSSGVAASGATSYPSEVDFLLYPAGTWVRGSQEVITIDTLYDSVMLGTNDYTALFTEEGWVAVKMCHDSRVVTVPICPDGSTAAAVAIDCDGTAGS